MGAGRECELEVVDEIVGVLEADGEPDEGGPDAGRREFALVEQAGHLLKGAHITVNGRAAGLVDGVAEYGAFGTRFADDAKSLDDDDE